MRSATLFALLLILAACGSAPGTTGTQESEDWIEVPLRDDVFWQQSSNYRTDTLDIHVLPGPGLEVKLAMKAGDTVVYSWQAGEMDQPERLISEFHGHTDREPGEPGTLMYYRKGTGTSDSGMLVAPFDGIHGWYLKNDSYTPVTVQLRVAGFYQLED